MHGPTWTAIPLGIVALLTTGMLCAPPALAVPMAARGGIVGASCGDNAIDPSNSRFIDKNTVRTVDSNSTEAGTNFRLETGTSPQFGQVFWATATGRGYRKFGVDWTSDRDPNGHPTAVNWNYCDKSPDLSGPYRYTYAVEQANKRWFRLTVLDSYGNWSYTYWHFT